MKKIKIYKALQLIIKIKMLYMSENKLKLIKSVYINHKTEIKQSQMNISHSLLMKKN